ncbi:interleukin-10 receptor subunit alpha [Xyrauchen texanus]|uniref:interleukin-10 receptor subunit alpha n=1 Tax=Xyrauchen texanus TaxID=154827 RepID=UPI002241EEE3|nr:interleukin-10 receptor subunit alpha [Xyrauchen texanus]
MCLNCTLELVIWNCCWIWCSKTDINMDWNAWILALVLLIHIPIHVADARLELNVTFEIWEGNVTVLWDPPTGAPKYALYQVKQALYLVRNASWHVVPNCNMTTDARCDIGNLVNQPDIKIMVGLYKGNDSFVWSTVHRIRLSDSKLLEPDFNLFSSPNTVKVKIYRKQFLEKLFAFGPSYTVTLQAKGQDSQNVTKSGDDEDDEVEFRSLRAWQEYCVSVTVMVESAGLRNTSLQRCIYAEADMSVVISMVIIGVLCIMTFSTFAICCFLNRPRKMPAALKSSVNGWHPMNIGLVQVEAVTDKGWLLTSNKLVVNTKVSEMKTELFEEDKERRESADSGVSVGHQHSIKDRGTDGHTGDEDSGCGSLTESEDCLSGERRSLGELPSLDIIVNNTSSEGKEDSGLGIGNQDVSDSLKGADSGLLSEIVVVGDGYRGQSPSGEAQSEITITDEIDNNMASPRSGYRSGNVTCLCSDIETCMWCKARKLITTDCDSGSHEQTSCTFTIESNSDRNRYMKKYLMQTVNVSQTGDLSTQLEKNCSNSSSLFISCPLFLQEGGHLPCQLETLPLTLGDLELKFT